MVSKIPSSTEGSIEGTRTGDTSSRQFKKQKFSAVQRNFTKRAGREQKRRKNDRWMEKSVKAYRLQTSQLLISLQRNNASALHALTKTYVTCHGGDTIPHSALPEILKIPTITLLILRNRLIRRTFLVVKKSHSTTLMKPSKIQSVSSSKRRKSPSHPILSYGSRRSFILSYGPEDTPFFPILQFTGSAANCSMTKKKTLLVWSSSFAESKSIFKETD